MTFSTYWGDRLQHRETRASFPEALEVFRARVAVFNARCAASLPAGDYVPEMRRDDRCDEDGDGLTDDQRDIIDWELNTELGGLTLTELQRLGGLLVDALECSAADKRSDEWRDWARETERAVHLRIAVVAKEERAA